MASLNIDELTLIDADAFSVVIPLFNKREFVNRSVSSVFLQSFANFELIVVDDGSTDDSLAAIAEFRSDPRLRVLRQLNQGPGPARNTGVLAATNRWVAFLDADDEWLPNHLDELMRVIKACPDAELVSTSFKEIIDASLHIEQQSPGRHFYIDLFHAKTHRLPFVNSSSAALTRDLIQQVGYFGAFYPAEDQDLWFKAALRTSVAVSDCVTSLYRQRTGGLTDTNEISPNEHLQTFPAHVRTLLTFVSGHPRDPKAESAKAYLTEYLAYYLEGRLLARDLQAARRAILEGRGIVPNSKTQAMQVMLSLPDGLVLRSLRFITTLVYIGLAIKDICRPRS